MGVGRLNAERVVAAHLERVRAPFVAVNQARRALLPRGARLALLDGASNAVTLKSFDFVLYGEREHTLLEVKGRRANFRAASGSTPSAPGRLECWITLGDVESLTTWQHLFGPPFRACVGFVYELTSDADAEGLSAVFEVGGRRHGLACVAIDDYRAHMKPRSVRWRTVDLPQASLAEIVAPLPPGWSNRAIDATGHHRSAHGSPAAPADPRQARSRAGLDALDDPGGLAEAVWLAATGAGAGVPAAGPGLG